MVPDEDADVSEEAAGASEGETRTRLGADAGPEEADALTHVEDADVDAADVKWNELEAVTTAPIARPRL